MKNLMTLIFVLTVFAASATNSITVNPDGTKDAKSSSTTTYTGKVIDSLSKEALAGVKITIENTNITVYSDFEGNFEIALPENATLNNVQVSYISYEEKTLTVSEVSKDSIEINPIF
jgi:hypothetical protein